MWQTSGWFFIIEILSGLQFRRTEMRSRYLHRICNWSERIGSRPETWVRANIPKENQNCLLKPKNVIPLFFFLFLSFIFWGQTDSWSFNNPTGEIYRATMSGKNQTSIASKNIGIVSGIAIDHSRNRLFWADRHLQLIESSDFNGNDRRVVFYSNVSIIVSWSSWNVSLNIHNYFTRFTVRSTCTCSRIRSSG